MTAQVSPIQVTHRQLIATLRQEASAVCRNNKNLRNVMADIAARDLLESGKVRLVSSHRTV